MGETRGRQLLFQKKPFDKLQPLGSGAYESADMITVIFPAGAYGTFLASCLYMFTDISDQNKSINFSKHGSSHDIRSDLDFRSKFQLAHARDKMEVIDDRKTILISPNSSHRLDYFDNQFLKQNFGNLTFFLKELFPGDEFDQQLKKFNTTINEASPWQIRENISFWLNDCLSAGYDLQKYQRHNIFTISSVEFFEDKFKDTFIEIAKSLNLTVIKFSEFVEHHRRFIKLQKFNGIQLRCNRWVDDIISGVENSSPCITVFDEAYVQHLLRVRGFEIKCFELNEFPKNSTELRKLIQLA